MKLTILAVDGLDREVIGGLLDRLPSIRRCYDETDGSLCFSSVFPPDTDTAWASFYTGLSPAQHGLFKYTNPLERGAPVETMPGDGFFRGRTFWDLASRRALRTCVCLPHHIFPGWEINGVTVTRPQQPDAASPVVCTPAGIRVDDRVSRAVAAGRLLFSDRELNDVLRYHREKFEAETELALDLHEREEWDLFFAYFSAVDGAQHYFWRFHEPGHPDHEPGSDYQHVVREFYERTDALIGRFLERLRPGEHLLIVSDHGHGRRPTRLLQLNEYLRQCGFLQSEQRARAAPGLAIRRGMKGLMKAVIARYGVPPLAHTLVRRFPALKQDFASTGGIDFTRSAAFVDAMPSMKGYSYGGIRINAAGDERETLISRVMDALREVRDPVTGRTAVTWMERRERVDAGQYLERMPDILVETDPDLGIAAGVHCPLVENGFMHRVQSGGHRRTTPTLLTAGFSPEARADLSGCGGPVLTLMDLHRFVLAFIERRTGLPLRTKAPSVDGHAVPISRSPTRAPVTCAIDAAEG
jgi:predicted AlkP superfamily phosphohydrolase/phosphomutase